MAELGFGVLCHQAVGESAEGAVLALSSGGYPTAPTAADEASRLQHSGAAGVLADGRLRIFDQLGGYGLRPGVAARPRGRAGTPSSPSPPRFRRGRRRLRRPGDYLHADASGADVIPAASRERVIDEAIAIEAEDARFADEIADEDAATLRRGDARASER